MAEEKDRDHAADLKSAEEQRKQAEARKLDAPQGHDADNDRKLAEKQRDLADMRKLDEHREKSAKEEAERVAKEPVVIVADETGGQFNIRGAGFGGSVGNMTVGGVPVKVTRWDDSQIRGVLPAGVEGPVMINGVARGTFPPVRATTLPVAHVQPIPVVVVDPGKEPAVPGAKK